MKPWTSWSLRSGISILVVALFGAAGVALLSPAAMGSAAGVHSARTSFQPPTFLAGTDCPSTTVCYIVGQDSAGGGEIVATQDGGNTWSVQTVPSGVGGLGGIACVSTTACYAVGTMTGGGAAFLGTVDGGTTWTTGGIPTKVDAFGNISCPGASTCFVTASESADVKLVYVSVTTDGGASWHTKPLHGDGRESAGGIACTSDLTCFMTGELITDGGPKRGPSSFSAQAAFQPISSSGLLFETSDGGDTWVDKSRSLSNEIGSLGGVTCPSTAICFASGQIGGGEGVIETRNSGASWSVLNGLPEQLGFLAAISCPTNRVCFGAGATGGNDAGVVVATSNGGTTWTNERVGIPYALQSISCPSKEICFATPFDSENDGGQIATTDDGGSTWTVETVPS
jgi:photosystem II stability/assembly factor-like uncharacterized protein